MLVFCKMNVSIVKSSKYDYRLSKPFGRWSVDLWSVFHVINKRVIWGRDFACALWSRFILLFNFFFYIDDKEKTKFTRIFNYS